MSIESRRHQYGTVFDHWQIGELLGASKNGQTAVFHLQHKESSQEESAVKIITLIEEHGKLSEFTPCRKAEYEAELERRKEHALQEVQLMYALKGYTNIVSYEDRVTEHWTENNSFGCDLLIRMELLRDLRKIIRTGHIFPETEIIQIGKDICTALRLCHGEDNPVIHRDIKPENIFVNARGTYKLGDFGVSRILDKCHGTTATTAIGTPAYLAPEQAQKGYDERVDIYSLGLVLYELSNQNRLPFAETVYDTEKAILLRMAGNKLPVPSKASANFARVILKACAFKADDRYQTAEEMLEALEQLSTTRSPASVKLEKNPARDIPGTFETVPAMEASRNKDSFATVPAIAKASNVATEEMSDPVLPRSNTKDNLLSRADSGDAAAQVQLGVNYCRGVGVSTDADKAFYWFKKAANQGHALGQYNLGLCYELGSGIRKNIKTAKKLYQKAADQGCGDARKRLDNILEDLAEKRAQQESALKKWYLVQGFVVLFIAVILGCVMWFTSGLVWHTILVVALLAAISMYSLGWSSRKGDGIRLSRLGHLLLCIMGAISVPLVTAIVIAIIEGVLWLCR